jgi:two-component system, LytTR family, response regulator
MMDDRRTVRAIIVDDEALSRDIIREYLDIHQEVTVITECANGFEAVKAITEEKPDLVFLDIQMPKLNGFEVLDLVSEEMAVVFTTAYDEYALKAFEVHAADYLLKPFSRQRFDEALMQAMKHVSSRGFPAVYEMAAQEARRRKPIERILVRVGSQVHVVPASSVDYIEAQDDYVRIVAGSKKYLKQQGLSELEECLDGERFLRIHRSYLLNIEVIAGIELYAKDSRVAVLKDGTRLPVSRAGYEKIKAVL